MKIVIASDMYWPAINGVSVFSRNLARGLAERGHQVVVLAPSQTGEAYEEADGGAQVVRLKSVSFPFYHNQVDKVPEKKFGVYSNGFKVSLTPSKEIKAVFDEFKPDVVHNQQYLIIGQAVSRIARKRGIPIVFTNHVMTENLLDNLRLIAPFSRPINTMLRHYGMNFMKNFDYITMPTERAIGVSLRNEKDLRKIKVPIKAISNGIDLSRFKPDAKWRDQKIVSYIGRMDKEKHIGVLVEAFRDVLGKVPQASLLLVGDGNDTSGLKQQVAEIGLSDKVTFAGRVTGDELVRLHQVGTVFCMPSPVELQSIATLEAMACGQPVVAVNAGALAELCQNGVNGFLISPDDIEQTSKGLTKILADDTLRTEFSRASLEIARKHDMQYTLDQYEEVYREVIAARE